MYVCIWGVAVLKNKDKLGKKKYFTYWVTYGAIGAYYVDIEQAPGQSTVCPITCLFPFSAQKQFCNKRNRDKWNVNICHKNKIQRWRRRHGLFSPLKHTKGHRTGLTGNWRTVSMPHSQILARGVVRSSGTCPGILEWHAPNKSWTGYHTVRVLKVQTIKKTQLS